MVVLESKKPVPRGDGIKDCLLRSLRSAVGRNERVANSAIARQRHPAEQNRFSVRHREIKPSDQDPFRRNRILVWAGAPQKRFAGTVK